MRVLKRLTVVSLLVLAACGPQQQPPATDGAPDGAMQGSSRAMEKSMRPKAAEPSMEPDAGTTDATMPPKDEGVSGDEQVSTPRTIAVQADNWSFTPSSITATKGEDVTIAVQGVAGIHGFAVPDLGINVTVNPGETVYMKLPTDAAGSYTFRCSIPCGPGHKEMVGTIVIEE
jgi:heme/copper-type cytochrome/quinol oxidase subunit 2